MYSQNEEEKVILNYFGETKGTFLDVGANDGVTLSNTRALAEKGWCGVLVEPSPRAFSRLKANYSVMEKKGCIYMYPFALGETKGSVMLDESGPLISKTDVALVSTIVESEKKRFERTVTYEKTSVECFTYRTFLNRLSIKKFDFISIDAEGCDEVILKQIDVSETKCICIEWNGRPELKISFSQYLADFKIIYTSAENLIFAR
jgi:FkbM family methyltransferase